MAETPTFVKRVKSKTIRARDENNEEEGVAEVKTVVSNFKNKAKGRSKPQSRLSFGLEADEGGEGDDGGVFQVKKSALSRKMKSGISVSSSPGASITARLEQTSIATRQEGPKYDAAYLQELKASTNSARPPNFDSSRTGEKMDVDSELTFDESEMDGAVIENMEELPLISTHTKETLIPTESSIKAAKEKRDRLRKTGAATGGEEDFISLTVAKRDDFAPGPHPESRLMREDDDLGEGDDDDAEYTGAQERIALSKKGRKEEAKQRKKGIAEMIEEVTRKRWNGNSHKSSVQYPHLPLTPNLCNLESTRRSQYRLQLRSLPLTLLCFGYLLDWPVSIPLTLKMRAIWPRSLKT